MTHEESVTGWLRALRSGDSAATQKLWDRYFKRMVAVARKRLSRATAAFDEEDVALSAFDLVTRGIREGRFDLLASREDLWRLLVASTNRKALDRMKAEGAAKRGGGRAAKSRRTRLARQNIDLDDLASDTADPHFTALMSDECLRLLTLLKDDELQQAAQWKLEGYTDDEMARKMGYSRRTVQRMLAAIRATWSREIETADA